MKKYTSAVQSTKKDFDQNSAYLCTGSKQSEYFYCMHIIIVEMLLVVIELPQLPLLLLLKLHVHRKVCAGAAAAAELFIIVCRMTHFVAVDYCTWFQCLFSLCERDLFWMHPLAVLSRCRIVKPRFTYNSILVMHVMNPRIYGHAQSQCGRQPIAAKTFWYFIYLFIFFSPHLRVLSSHFFFLSSSLDLIQIQGQ